MNKTSGINDHMTYDIVVVVASVHSHSNPVSGNGACHPTELESSLLPRADRKVALIALDACNQKQKAEFIRGAHAQLLVLRSAHARLFGREIDVNKPHAVWAAANIGSRTQIIPKRLLGTTSKLSMTLQMKH